MTLLAAIAALDSETRHWRLIASRDRIVTH